MRQAVDRAWKAAVDGLSVPGDDAAAGRGGPA